MTRWNGVGPCRHRSAISTGTTAAMDTGNRMQGGVRDRNNNASTRKRCGYKKNRSVF